MARRLRVDTPVVSARDLLIYRVLLRTNQPSSIWCTPGSARWSGRAAGPSRSWQPWRPTSPPAGWPPSPRSSCTWPCEPSPTGWIGSGSCPATTRRPGPAVHPAGGGAGRQAPQLARGATAYARLSRPGPSCRPSASSTGGFSPSPHLLRTGPHPHAESVGSSRCSAGGDRPVRSDEAERRCGLSAAQSRSNTPGWSTLAMGPRAAKASATAAGAPDPGRGRSGHRGGGGRDPLRVSAEQPRWRCEDSAATRRGGRRHDEQG